MTIHLLAAALFENRKPFWLLLYLVILTLKVRSKIEAENINIYHMTSLLFSG